MAKVIKINSGVHVDGERRVLWRVGAFHKWHIKDWHFLKGNCRVPYRCQLAADASRRLTTLRHLTTCFQFGRVSSSRRTTAAIVRLQSNVRPSTLNTLMEYFIIQLPLAFAVIIGNSCTFCSWFDHEIFDS